MSSFGERSSTWNENSVRNTWTMRRPCAAGCKPPDQRLERTGASSADRDTAHQGAPAARLTPLAREVGDSYLEWPAAAHIQTCAKYPYPFFLVHQLGAC